MKDIIGDKQLKVLSPGKIGGLELRNRIIRSGCFEGMCPRGYPSEPLLEHHREVAAGGTAMTTVAYCGDTDAINVSTSIEYMTGLNIPGYAYPEGPMVRMATKIKSAVKVPVIAVGKISPELAEQLVAD